MTNNPHNPTTDFAFSCPAPLADYPEIILAHGAGGTLTKSLIDKLFAPLLQNKFLDQMHDGAVLDTTANRLAFTTDSYVVKPLFFPAAILGRSPFTEQSMISSCAGLVLFIYRSGSSLKKACR